MDDQRKIDTKHRGLDGTQHQHSSTDGTWQNCTKALHSQDQVCNVDVVNQTGLLPVVDTSSNVATPFLVTRSECRALSQSIKFYAARLGCLSAGSKTDHGNVIPVVLRNACWTKSVLCLTTADEWRDAVEHGHRGATQQSLTTTC